MESASPSQSSGVGKDGKQISTFEVFVIGQNLSVRHARTQQFEKCLYWVAKATNAGLTVAHCGVDRDPRK